MPCGSYSAAEGVGIMEVSDLGLEALQEVPTGIGVFDVCEGTIDLKYINDGYYQMVGQPREERTAFAGQRTIFAIHPDDREGLLKEAALSMQEKRVFSYHFRVQKGDGSYLWLGINANHRPLNETTERFYAAYYNVDDLIRKQSALELYSQQRDAILDKIPGGVAIFCYEKNAIRLVYTNPGFYEVHHGSKAFWAGKDLNPVTWLTLEDRSLFLQEFDRVLRGEKNEGNVAYRIWGEDGKLHWINNQFRPAYTDKGTSYFYASFTSLDSQKALDAARLEARKMYESTVEEAKLVVWEYDILNHRITMAENEFTAYDYRKFSLPKVTENAPTSLLPYIDEASQEAFLKMYRAIDDGAPRAECEVWYKLRPGIEPRCERITYTTVYDAEGKPIKAYGIGQNITSRKREEEEYEQIRTELFTHLSESVSSTQFNLSKNLYLKGYSPFPAVLASLEKKTADEHFAAATNAISDAKRKEEIRQEFNCANLLKLYEKGVEQLSEEYPIRSSKGTILWIHTSLTLMQNPHTGDIEGISFSKNITLERENAAILALLAKDGSDFIGLISLNNALFTLHDGIWKCAEIAAGNSLPYEQARGLLINTYLPLQEREQFAQATTLNALKVALEDKNQFILPYDFEKEGQSLAKKQISFRYLDESREKILVLQQDVTAAYKKDVARMKELEEAREKADTANAAKSEFLSQMSHDIRTPLNGIIGMSYLASEQDNPPKTVDCLHKIDTSSKYLLSLINDILDMSKAESGKIELQLLPYPFAEFNAYLESLILPLCKAKDQHFTFDHHAIDPAIVPLADKLRINQIAFNLLSNAVKYTPEDGHIVYSLSGRLLEGKRVEITQSIRDDGIGMSEEFQKTLFQPFTQENRLVSPEMHGTGLGLAIVKKLVDVMGGSIHVESAPGKGTTFVIVLTFAYVSADKIPAKPLPFPSSRKSVEALQGKRILLFEDNPLNQEIARALLGEKGLLVDVANNGEEGLRIFKEAPLGHYNAILMDVHMPIMDGYEATKRIRMLPREDAHRIPVIAMTADAFAEDVRKALDAGMNAHIAKPIEPQQLIETIIHFLVS